jgi:hypothetical protein
MVWRHCDLRVLYVLKHGLYLADALWRGTELTQFNLRWFTKFLEEGSLLYREPFCGTGT